MSETASKTVTICNAKGIHARPASLITKTVMHLDCDIRLKANGLEASGKEVLEILSLVATCGTDLIIEAEGPGAEAAVDELVELVLTGFNFD